jgi:CBS domain-containing protein
MGILTKTRLITALHERGLEAKVSDVMDTDLKPVRPDEPLAEVHQKMVESGVTAMPVVDEGHIVGMISLENIGRFFMVSSALKKGAA